MSESPVVQALTVPAEPPKFPLVLAAPAFMSTLAAVEKDVAALRVDSPESYKLAASLLQRLTGAGKQLDAQRLALKRPLLEIGRKIDDAAQPALDRIEQAKQFLKGPMAAYEDEQTRAAEQAEAKRKAEIHRLVLLKEAEEKAARDALERIKREALEKEAQEKARLQKLADDAAAAKQVETLDLDMDIAPPPMKFEHAPAPESAAKTETEKRLETIMHAPAIVAPAKPTGISYRVKLVATVTNVNLLPEPFVEKTPKQKAINATFCDGWKEGQAIPECPGVAFTVDRQMISTGRNLF